MAGPARVSAQGDPRRRRLLSAGRRRRLLSGVAELPATRPLARRPFEDRSVQRLYTGSLLVQQGGLAPAEPRVLSRGGTGVDYAAGCGPGGGVGPGLGPFPPWGGLDRG